MSDLADNMRDIRVVYKDSDTGIDWNTILSDTIPHHVGDISIDLPLDGGLRIFSDMMSFLIMDPTNFIYCGLVKTRKERADIITFIQHQEDVSLSVELDIRIGTNKGKANYDVLSQGYRSYSRPTEVNTDELEVANIPVVKVYKIDETYEGPFNDWYEIIHNQDDIRNSEFLDRHTYVLDGHLGPSTKIILSKFTSTWIFYGNIVAYIGDQYHYDDERNISYDSSEQTLSIDNGIVVYQLPATQIY